MPPLSLTRHTAPQPAPVQVHHPWVIALVVALVVGGVAGIIVLVAMYIARGPRPPTEEQRQLLGHDSSEPGGSAEQ